MFVSLELRPRLNAANCFVRGAEFLFPAIHSLNSDLPSPAQNGQNDAVNLAINLENNVLAIRNADVPALQPLLIEWPPGAELNVGEDRECVASNLVTSKAGGEIVFRLQFVSRRQGTNIISRAEGDANFLKSWSATYKKPACLVNAPNDACAIRCAECACAISAQSFKLARMLPLPSISWREFSQDWFCGCSHPKSKDNTEEENDPCNGDGHAETEAASDKVERNTQLPARKLAPSPGDLLFAPGFVCVAPDAVDRDRIDVVSDKSIYCSDCDSMLGYSDGDTFQLWQHAVVFTDKDEVELPDLCSAEDTFLDLLRAVLSESPEKVTKVFFASLNASLCVWILDKNPLNLYTAEVDQPAAKEDEDPVKISVRKNEGRIKVLFKIAGSLESETGKDFASTVVKVNADILSAARSSLESSQDILPQSHRRHNDWEVAVIKNWNQ